MRGASISKPPCSWRSSSSARDLSSSSSTNRCSIAKRYIPSWPRAGEGGCSTGAPFRVHTTWPPLRRTSQLVPLLSNSASKDSAGGSPLCGCSRCPRARIRLLLPLALGPVTMMRPEPLGANSKPGSMPGRALIFRHLRRISCLPLAPKADPRRGNPTFAAIQQGRGLWPPSCSNGAC